MAFYPARQIVDGLWIGSAGDSRNAAFVKRHNIRLIVNCSKTIPCAFQDVACYRVPVDDDPRDDDTMLMFFPFVVSVINDARARGDNVLVHCFAGVSRSSTVVAAYLMWKYQLRCKDAVDFIRARKAETFLPEMTFKKALTTYSAILRDR